AEAVSVPVIAGGGAGNAQHVFDVIDQGRAEAVALASILHYDCIRSCQNADKDYKAEGNIEFLKKGAGFSKIQDTPLPEIKAHLRALGVDCRILEEV
ncbi:MAG: imidazole glycerol phosphate synthase subunit HisF, partial [Proteobacteria bacterium]|nr:imidazole glycerol phosphate synthase subunit HisF [Pseudomonadota bacterium]